MGMAASQARYLALTARKTNTEYEGQQINQARTALANQSANLFNRLLNMEVPNPPKTTDYTKVQYSYSDGDNASVIDSWEQLSSADPNYNYIVNHYYYSNIYTGYQRLLQNPEVTVKGDVLEEDITTRVPAPVITYNVNDGTVVIDDGVNVQTYSSLQGVNLDKKLENSLKDFEEAKGLLLANGKIDTNNIFGWKDDSDTWHFMVKQEVEEGTYKDYWTNYTPTYVGNCKLEELALPLDPIDDAALSQIIKDVHDSNMNDYISFNPQDGLVYNGSGVYKFQMNGKTYYTNKTDLNNSMATYDEYGKPIENQFKLAYYGAEDINTKIEKKNHALLETDGEGRFKSVKFDDDSIVYSLNTETITDEAAYEDAMNQYLYKKAQYEKTIADINARTSIIQKEDRTLELRLKQLDTEQQALKTEMDAVKKVISENIDATFKTFGD